MTLLLSLPGRFTFVNLARCGLFNEATYRYHFAKVFDFMSFNRELIDRQCSTERIIAARRPGFDPSYLRCYDSNGTEMGVKLFLAGADYPM